MTNIELKALRQHLFYSRTEAAALVAASAARPKGVSDRAWRMWEDGTIPVPEDVSIKIRALIQYRENTITTLKTQKTIRWIDTLEEWRAEGQGGDVFFKPYQSAVAQVLSTGLSTLIHK